jgi:hypothetical protein
MTVERESVDAGRLKTLAENANREHSQAQRAKRQSLKHATEAGGLLLKAKEEVGHGNFMKWVKENFEGSERVARKYMRLATAADEKRIDPAGVSSLAEAERLLREQEAEQTHGKYEPEVPGEEYNFRNPNWESEESGAGAEPAPQPAKGPSLSKKKGVDPLRDALKVIGRALGAASDEQRAEWAQILHDEIDLYIGSLDQEEAA